MARDVFKVLLMTTANGKDPHQLLQEEFKDFQEEEGIKIEFSVVSWNRAYQTIIKGFKEGESPDVLQLGSTWIRPLANMNYIEPVAESVSFATSLADWLNEYCFYQGKQVAVPWIADPVVMSVWRKTMNDLKISSEDIKDWEGFSRAIENIAEMRKHDQNIPKPLTVLIRKNMETVHCLSAWFFAAGYHYPDLSNKTNYFLNNPDFLELIDYIYRLIRKSGLTVDDVDKHPHRLVEEYRYDNGYVFNVGGCYGIIDNIKEQGKESRYKILSIPAPHNQTGAYSGAAVLAISSRTKFPEKASKFIKRLTEDEFLSSWVNYTGAIPAVESAFWKSRNDNEDINRLYEMVASSNSYPVHACWTSIEQIMSTSVSNILWELFSTSSYQNIRKRVLELIEDTDKRVIRLLKYSWGS